MYNFIRDIMDWVSMFWGISLISLATLLALAYLHYISYFMILPLFLIIIGLYLVSVCIAGRKGVNNILASGFIIVLGLAILVARKAVILGFILILAYLGLSLIIKAIIRK